MNRSRTQATDRHVHDPSPPYGSSCPCSPDGDSSSPSSCTSPPPPSPSWEKDFSPFNCVLTAQFWESLPARKDKHTPVQLQKPFEADLESNFTHYPKHHVLQDLSSQEVGISRAHIIFFKSNIIEMKVFPQNYYWFSKQSR